MLCRTCRRRPTCLEPCPDLEADLRSREGYQREMNLPPETIALVADLALFSLADLQPDEPWPWDAIASSLVALDPLSVELFLARYLDGKSVNDIARQKRLHRVTVGRKLRAAVATIASARGEMRVTPGNGPARH